MWRVASMEPAVTCPDRGITLPRPAREDGREWSSRNAGYLFDDWCCPVLAGELAGQHRRLGPVGRLQGRKLVGDPIAGDGKPQRCVLEPAVLQTALPCPPKLPLTWPDCINQRENTWPCLPCVRAPGPAWRLPLRTGTDSIHDRAVDKLTCSRPRPRYPIPAPGAPGPSC